MKNFSLLFLMTFLLSFWRAEITHAQVELVADINPNGDSNPGDFMEVNGELYLSAYTNTPIFTKYLYKYDAVADTVYKVNGSPNNVNNLIEINNELYYTQNNQLDKYNPLTESFTTVYEFTNHPNVYLSEAALLGDYLYISGYNTVGFGSIPHPMRRFMAKK